jgi:hypothetical protein
MRKKNFCVFIFADINRKKFYSKKRCVVYNETRKMLKWFSCVFKIFKRKKGKSEKLKTAGTQQLSTFERKWKNYLN